MQTRVLQLALLNDIIGAIAIIIMVSQMFDRKSTLQLIGITSDIPSLPDRYARIQEVINDPASGAADLARIVGTDQATSAMVLKFANSPFHNPMRQNIRTLSMAIARLGTRETGHIAMTMSLLYGFAIPAGMTQIRDFWAHAFAVALLSREMAALLGVEKEELFIAGLLHDIGRAILGIRVDMAYFEGKLARLYGDELVSAECQVYGVDHAEVGAEILRLWNFPDSIRVLVANHHNEEANSVSEKIIRLASDEVHKRFPYASDIDHVEQTLMEKPERTRILLEREGLLESEESDQPEE